MKKMLLLSALVMTGLDMSIVHAAEMSVHGYPIPESRSAIEQVSDSLFPGLQQSDDGTYLSFAPNVTPNEAAFQPAVANRFETGSSLAPASHSDNLMRLRF